MERIRIKNIFSDLKDGNAATVCGWIRTKRVSKEIAFLALNDGSTQETLQLVVPAESNAFKQLSNCNTGAAIKAIGLIKASPGKGQKLEMEVSDIEVFGDADQEKYPLQKKGHTLEFLRDIGHLRPRTNTFGAVFRVRNVLANAVHDFFQSKGFVWIHTPIITASDCEGAGDLFTVTSINLEQLPRDENDNIDFTRDFFGRQAYLTVSGQLEAEFLAMSLGDVYAFGPTFRAENSNTSRHLSEFWMIEPEIAFADLKDDMHLAEEFIQYLCKAVLTKCANEIAFFEKFYKNTSARDLEALAEKNFIHIPYTDAIKELEKSKVTFEFPVQWGLDLQSEHERYLTDKIFKGPVIVTDYPKDIKAFYMRLNPDEETVAAMDVLVPKIGEIIGGSQREERLDVLEKRMDETGVPRQNMDWYLDLRRFGSAPHAGFGLGFERFVQYITGMSNIRDVIPCPRAPQSIKF
jgi:asparaginyl-tRNA synthetase